MEKLQTAIEKARAQRRQASSKEVVPERPPVPQTYWPDEDDALARWAELPVGKISAQTLKSGALVSYSGAEGSLSFDMLRTRIMQQAQSNGWKRVAVVSPHSGCGKTTIAANLAFSFGRRSEQHTIILDLDLRRPALAQTLGQRPEHSMADVLEGRIAFGDHALRFGDNVALGLNPGPVPGSSEILQSQRTRDVLADIEADYGPDIMLFDMPPLQSTDDNYGFLGNVDCALLVAEMDRTTIPQIDAAERQLADLTNVMGIVLNKNSYRADAYGYDY